MRKRVTTICCSALALVLPLATSGSAQAPAARFPLFPVSTRWTVTIDATLAHPPGFYGDRAVFVLAGGRIAAYDLQEGTALWTVEQPATASPVVTADRALVLNDRTLTALDLGTGLPVWHIETSARLSAPVTAAGGWLMTADEDGVVTAYRGADGSRIWSTTTGGPTVHPVSVEGDRAYVARQDGTIVALHIESGSLVWSRRIGGTPQPVLPLRDRIFVGSDDNFLYCLMASDGRIDWRWRTGGDIVGRPAFDDDRVYVVSLDTLIRGLDRRHGAQRWKQALPLRPTRGAVAAPGAVLVSGVNPVVHGVGTKDGAPAGTIDAGGLLAAAPHVVPAPTLPSAIVVVVAQSPQKGTVMTAVTRSLEPAATPVQPIPDSRTPPSGPGALVAPPGSAGAALPTPPPVVFDPPPPSADGGNR